MEKLFGIDLGTTNSAISVYTGNNTSQIIPLLENDGKKYTTMPSVVQWLGGDNWVVGREAYQHRYESNAVYSIKSKIGKDYIHTFTYKNETCQRTPIEISAMILKSLCKKAEYLYPDIKKVTITVPAEFGDRERKETRDAGILAGLDVVDIINEPTAAALRYPINGTEKVLVYDLGGGTFDLTLLEISKATETPDNLNFKELGISLSLSDKEVQSEKYDVIASGGNRHLGGDDLDKYVLNNLLINLQTQYADDAEALESINSLSLEDYEKLKLRVSEAKTILCSAKAGSVELNTAGIFSDSVKVLVKDSDMEEGTKTLYLQTKTCIDNLLASKVKSKKDINKIILIGGSTKNVFLKNFISGDFKNYKIIATLNPDESVALGASIKTAITCNQSNISVTDVAAYSVGVGVKFEDAEGNLTEGRIEHLVKRNTPLPAVSIKNFSLSDLDNDIDIKFYSGDSTFVDQCTLIGTYVLKKTESSEFASIITTINSQGILDIKIKSGKDELSLTLNKVDNSSNNTGSLGVRDKLVLRWKRILNNKQIPITDEVSQALEGYAKTGDIKYKNYITSLLENNSKGLTSEFGD